MSFSEFHPTMVGKKVYHEYVEWFVDGPGKFNNQLELSRDLGGWQGYVYATANVSDVEFKKDRDQELIKAHMSIRYLESALEELTWRVESLEQRLDGTSRCC